MSEWPNFDTKFDICDVELVVSGLSVLAQYWVKSNPNGTNPRLQIIFQYILTKRAKRELKYDLKKSFVSEQSRRGIVLL